jgi:hypothetical protein
MRTFPSGRLILCLLSLWLCCTAVSYASLDTLKGEINIYTPVLAIDYCHSVVVVQSSKGFAAGDKVLIIQMKGATIDTADSSTFGDLVSYNDAGNFELGTIAWVDGTSIFLQKKLVRSYTISGLVQLIRVPVYTNAVIDSVVGARPWDGRVGGVVAMIVTDTLNLMGKTISATTCGFRGGSTSVSDTSYHSQMGYRYSTSDHRGGRKGEGIVEYDSSYDRGRGHLANGGGGGNAYSSGGGGGGNGGSGGMGGDQYRRYGDSAIGGYGGAGLAYDTTMRKIFLGGGGGGGHKAGNGATAGRPGGGIVIVRAGTFIGNDGHVEADGGGRISFIVEASSRDGGGGAGSGGTILLDIANWPLDTSFHLHADGGKAYNASSAPSPDSLACFGPGGGGAGGVIWSRDTAAMGLGALRTMTVAGGSSGAIVSGTSPCDGLSYGSSNGSTGVILEDVIIPKGTEPR